MKTTDSKRLQSAISRRYVVRFVVQAVVMTAAIAALGLFVLFLIQQRVWYEWDPLYRILKYLEGYVPVFVLLLWLAGMLVVLLLLMRRVARSYLAMAQTIAQMSVDETAEINLPDDLREIQGMLRQVQAHTLQSRRAATEAEQRKNDLVVYLAHDLKTPLTSVLGYLALLRDEEDLSPELQQKYLQIATAKAQRLEDLINEFFEITRFSLKGIALQPTHLCLSRMMEQLCDEFRPLFVPKNLSFVAHIEQDIWLWADAGRLQRVVDNLLRNAISYSTPDTEVVVGAAVQDGGALLWVSNRGPAIPPHKQAHVFEQFYRADEARSGEEGGAGLGLAIAKEIVELHGGRIGVQSENDVTNFVVWLPLHTPGIDAPEAPPQP